MCVIVFLFNELSIFKNTMMIIMKLMMMIITTTIIIAITTILLFLLYHFFTFHPMLCRSAAALFCHGLHKAHPLLFIQSAA